MKNLEDSAFTYSSNINEKSISKDTGKGKIYVLWGFTEKGEGYYSKLKIKNRRRSHFPDFKKKQYIRKNHVSVQKRRQNKKDARRSRVISARKKEEEIILAKQNKRTRHIRQPPPKIDAHKEKLKKLLHNNFGKNVIITFIE